MELMTIQQFAKFTGTRPSVLRFYEEKGLLTPQHRGENGYRFYSHDQVAVVKLIISLRNAGMAVQEIRHFLSMEKVEKERHLEKLRDRIEQRLLSLQLAAKYIGGVYPFIGKVNLFRQDREVILWFRVISSGEPLYFLPEVARCNQILRAVGLNLPQHLYLRPVEDDVADLGYPLLQDTTGEWTVPQGGVIETVPPTLYLSFSSEIGNASGFSALQDYIRKNDLTPVGSCMEYFTPNHVLHLFDFIDQVGSEGVSIGQAGRAFFAMKDAQAKYEWIVPIQRF